MHAPYWSSYKEQNMKIKEWIVYARELDLMKRINTNLRKPASGVNVCICNGFGYTADERKERCAEFCGNCSGCIEDLLDKEVQ